MSDPRQPSVMQVSLLLADLGFYDSDIPGPMTQQLEQLLVIADEQLLTDCRISIDPENLRDASLSAMYAAWLYSRARSGEPMPPMLRSAIRQRQVNAAIGGTA